MQFQLMDTLKHKSKPLIMSLIAEPLIRLGTPVTRRKIYVTEMVNLVKL